MFVCICHAFTDKDLSKALEQGISTPSNFFKHHEVEPNCGQCLSAINHFLKEKEATLFKSSNFTKDLAAESP